MSKTQLKPTTSGGKDQNWLEIGGKYLERFSIIPVGPDKKPMISWKTYQAQKATVEEIKLWCSQPNFMGFGAVTGPISGILVLDIDDGADVTGLDIPITPTVKTGYGLHRYFKYPKDTVVKNFAGFRPKMDIRGQGGYVVLPPTPHPNGNIYEWVTNLDTPVAEPPRWLISDLLDQNTHQSTNWGDTNVLGGVPLSTRNDSATKVIGKLLSHIPPKEWHSVAWPMVKGWNLLNQPPMGELELYGVFRSIASREATKRNANTGEKKIQQINGFTVSFKDSTWIEVKKDNFTYLLKPKGKKADLSLLQNNELINRDTLPLVSGKCRTAFVNGCTRLNKDQQAVVADHLMQLSQVLDKINSKILHSKKLAQTNTMSAEDEAAAIEQLKSPTLLYEISKAIKQLGVAGEEITGLLHYLVLTSRITDDPLSVIVKGESSAGKSYVVTQVLKLFPPDGYIDITDATAQSFFYAPEGHFAHKIIVIFEKHGGEKADYSIRTLQSEKKLKIQVTVKDPDTGEFASKEHEVEGPAGFITTTTDATIHQENETRHLSVYPDESIEQTGKTFESTDAKYRGISPVSDEFLAQWQNIQRMLTNYPVIIPYVEQLRKVFPKTPVRVRRDYGKLLALIAVITVLHQYQREKVELDGTEYLHATLADFHIAKILLEETLKKTIYSLSPKSEQVITAAKELLPEDSLLPGISIRDIATKLDWDYDTVKKWFDPAFQKGFFTETVEHKGSKPALYKPTDKQPPSKAILPATEELYELNPDWLEQRTLYDPIIGTIYKLQAKE